MEIPRDDADFQLNHRPLYNIKAVAHLAGLQPVTVRAWERRYGLPQPLRTEQGYRVYSEYDLQLLRWLKQQTDMGLTIGRAVERLAELRQMGQDPAQASMNTLSPTPVTPAAMAGELLQAFEAFNEESAVVIVRRAFALYAIDRVLIEVIQPALVEIGLRWEAGKLNVAVEHFATQFCLQYLMGMLSASAPAVHPGVVLAACAPGELHQIGLLMLVVMLRWRGHDIKYLGQSLPFEQLSEVIERIHPRMLMFTATSAAGAQALFGLTDELNKIKKNRPLLVVGGQGFDGQPIPESFTGVCLTGAPSHLVERIESLLVTKTVKNY